MTAKVTTIAAQDRPLRVLFVFAWLVVGGEETEVRLLAEGLDKARFTIDVVACFRKPGMPEQTHEQLRAAGVRVDTTPYQLDFEATVAYLAAILPGYDVVVSCQNVADIYPALERLHLRPPLIEHGGLVSEALAGPKHFTNRYIGVCETIRAAAASRMEERAHHALAIPSMVDLAAFRPQMREPTRAALGIKPDRVLIGWVGRLDAKKRVEDFIAAAAIVARSRADADFVVIGGPDAFMPDYADQLVAQAKAAGLGPRLQFTGDREDVSDLLCALDIFVWLSRGEGMPHVIAEAGAARLPVIATPDNGALEQIADGVSGVFVPHEDPAAVAAAMVALIDDPARRRALGEGLRVKVERDYATAAVLPRWDRVLREVAAERQRPAATPPLFESPVLGGFECSSHRRHGDGERRDMIALTDHDRQAEEDYRLAATLGMTTVRDGLRWHLIEAVPGRFDWDSAEHQIDASASTGTRVIWDLLHYGTPDWLDIWGAGFRDRFVTFALAAADRLAGALPGPLYLCPVNEISFFSWGGGDAGYLNPFARGRGHELKVQLAGAAIAATRAIRARHPDTRFFTAEPLINILNDPARPHEALQAEGHRLSQFQAFDMLAGTSWPQLGGAPDTLDVVGVNFYHNNQWIHGGPSLDWRDPACRSLSSLLAEGYARYGRPIFIAETGIEADERPAWIAYVAREAAVARDLGVPLEGVCLYPVIGHVGWDDDRYCPNGPIDQAPDGTRTIHQPSRVALTSLSGVFQDGNAA